MCVIILSLEYQTDTFKGKMSSMACFNWPFSGNVTMHMSVGLNFVKVSISSSTSMATLATAPLPVQVAWYVVLHF